MTILTHPTPGAAAVAAIYGWEHKPVSTQYAFDEDGGTVLSVTELPVTERASQASTLVVIPKKRKGRS